MTLQKVCSTCSSPCHRECRLLSGVHVVVSPTYEPRSHPSFDYGQTDMLVLSYLSGMNSHSFLFALDPQLDEVVRSQCQEHNFTGELGSYLLIDLEKLGCPRDNLRFILLSGIGHAVQFSRKAVCLTFGLAMAKAEELGLKKVSIPIPPHRMTSDNINLKGTAATLRCRLEQARQACGGFKSLSELEIFLTRQAKRHFDIGLEVGGSLCRVCGLKKLDSISKEL